LQASKILRQLSFPYLLHFYFHYSFTQARRQDVAAGGGAKTRRGPIFKILYNVWSNQGACMQQPGGEALNGGRRFQMGRPGTTGSASGGDPGSYIKR